MTDSRKNRFYTEAGNPEPEKKAYQEEMISSYPTELRCGKTSKHLFSKPGIYISPVGGLLRAFPQTALTELCSSRLKNRAAFNTVSCGYFPVCLQTACTKKLKRKKKTKEKGKQPEKEQKGKFTKKAPESALKFILQLPSINFHGKAGCLRQQSCDSRVAALQYAVRFGRCTPSSGLR